MDIQQLTGIFGVTNLSLSFVLILAWSLVWKGIALWKAARAGSKPWFIVLLIVNTVGILEIIYIFVINKKKTLDTNL